MRVLVVEDSQSLADVLVEGLRDQGMAVDAAHDGLAAAAKLDLNSYDVVVLDRDLPGIHGDALCQMITDRSDRAMVLMLTAAGAPGDDHDRAGRGGAGRDAGVHAGERDALDTREDGRALRLVEVDDRSDLADV